MSLRIGAGLYAHPRPDGAGTYHLDRQLSREQFALLLQTIHRSGIDGTRITCIDINEKRTVIRWLDPEYRAQRTVL